MDLRQARHYMLYGDIISAVFAVVVEHGVEALETADTLVIPPCSH